MPENLPAGRMAAMFVAVLVGFVLMAAGTVVVWRQAAEVAATRGGVAQIRQAWGDDTPLPDGVGAIVHIPLERAGNRTVALPAAGDEPAPTAGSGLVPKHPASLTLHVTGSAAAGRDPVGQVTAGDVVWVETSWAVFSYRVEEVAVAGPDGAAVPGRGGDVLLLVRHLPDRVDVVVARPDGAQPKVRV